jgi:hypothetical protein
VIFGRPIPVHGSGTKSRLDRLLHRSGENHAVINTILHEEPVADMVRGLFYCVRQIKQHRLIDFSIAR